MVKLPKIWIPRRDSHVDQFRFISDLATEDIHDIQSDNKLLGCHVLNSLRGIQASTTTAERFAVIRFAGISEFPHAHQLTVSSPGPSASTEVSKSDFEFLLVADLQKDELYLYTSRPLWRMDVGGIDEHWKTMWHQRGEAVDSYDVEMGNEASSTEAMWSSPNLKCVFLDALGLPIQDPLAKLKPQIRKCCERNDLGESVERTEGELVTQRVVNAATGELASKTVHSGKLFTSVSVLVNAKDRKSAQCKVVIYLFDKPMETMNGEISCSFTNSLPVPIRQMLNGKDLAHDQNQPVDPSKSNVLEPTQMDPHPARQPNNSLDDDGAFLR